MPYTAVTLREENGVLASCAGQSTVHHPRSSGRAGVDPGGWGRRGGAHRILGGQHSRKEDTVGHLTLCLTPKTLTLHPKPTAGVRACNKGLGGGLRRVS